MLRGLARADVARTVGFVMDGDSMEPTIQRTDIVFVDTSRQQIEARRHLGSGLWTGAHPQARRRRAPARVTSAMLLKSDNKMYPDQAFDPDEVTVFGRYVGRFSVF